MRKAAPSGPIPTFASLRSGHFCECWNHWNQRTTSKFRLLVEFRIWHSLSEFAASWVANVKSTPLGERLSDSHDYSTAVGLKKSAPLDLGDLVGFRTAGSHDFHGRALLLADQRARQRRGDGNLPFLGVGFPFADDLPHRLFLGVFVDQRDRRAELDGVAGQLRDVDDVGAR